MSTKYDTSDRRTLSDSQGDPVRLTDHAIHRWRQRTPADVNIGIRDAWRYGDFIKDAQVAASNSETDHPPLTDAVVFRSADDWSAVFLVAYDTDGFGKSEKIVKTVQVVSLYEHAPTRAYLQAYGPHDAEVSG